jgi:hypothetical protein
MRAMCEIKEEEKKEEEGEFSIMAGPYMYLLRQFH